MGTDVNLIHKRMDINEDCVVFVSYECHRTIGNFPAVDPVDGCMVMVTSMPPQRQKLKVRLAQNKYNVIYILFVPLTYKVKREIKY